jgi:hypothetical protein
MTGATSYTEGWAKTVRSLSSPVLRMLGWGE